ncbi:MAG: TMEM165/GDT1 family protein [Oligoflexia bacterium]|nr:TMEM165/GDT1 family protein [Oligoflexia bacterium]
MTHLKLFISTFSLIFLAELPDKTAFATVLLATRKNPLAVFLGASAAFVVQSLVAVCFGSVLGLLPHSLVKYTAAGMFFVFAWLMWRREDEPEDNQSQKGGRSDFLKVVWSSFLVIFIAEWGDLTQLATAALSAQYKEPLTIFAAATLSLWIVTALATLLGSRAKELIHPRPLKQIATAAFVIVGLIFLLGPV